LKKDEPEVVRAEEQKKTVESTAKPEISSPDSKTAAPPQSQIPPDPAKTPQAPLPRKTADMKELMVSFEALESELQSQVDLGEGYNPLPEHRFIFSDRYYPIEERRLLHYWRHLRYQAEKRPGGTIDMKTTIHRTAMQGGLPVLVYREEDFFEQHFLFLVDRGGSMTAFERLSDLLLRTVQESIRPAFMEVYYFHNLPGNLLFKDPYLSISISTEEVLASLKRHTLVFIISDAGAARGINDEDRTKRTFDFLDRIRTLTRHMLWFNPMPQSRWVGNSAFYIPFATDTLELSEESLNRLPQMLKHL
jgi:uncharacterized protein